MFKILLTVSSLFPILFWSETARSQTQTDCGGQLVTCADPQEGSCAQVCSCPDGTFFMDAARCAMLANSCAATTGTLDQSFGTKGYATTPGTTTSPFWSAENINPYYASIAVQPDGKIITGSSVNIGGTTPQTAKTAGLLLRYNPDGTLDFTFGKGGVFLSSEPGGPVGDYSHIAFQAVGKELKVIAFNLAETQTFAYSMYRFNADGTPDTSFKFITQPTFRVKTMAIRPDGKIIGVGSVGEQGFPSDSGSQDAALFRYLPDGSVDTTFGGTGVVKSDFGASAVESFEDVYLQNDGKILTAGYAIQYADDLATLELVEYNMYYILARYNADGTPDPTFKSGAQKSIPFDLTNWQYSIDDAFSVFPESDGGFILAGIRTKPQLSQSDAIFIRYNNDGTVDTSYGIGGIAVLPLVSEPGDFIRQPDGKILVSGKSNEPDASARGRLLARFNPDGTPDTAFDTDGAVSGIAGNEITIDSSCRILARPPTSPDDPENTARLSIGRYQ